MPLTIGCVCNLYNEANALPGFLESATSFFDDVRFYHAGPGGEYSNDGTIEIIEKWKLPITYGKIDDGFGVVRTATLRLCPCDWIVLLDADERFHRFAPLLACQGESTPPDEVNQILAEYDNREQKAVPSNFENLAKLGAKLNVEIGAVYNQGQWLRDLIEADIDAVLTMRRHWHDFSWKRPTQNWHQIPDHQKRIVRRSESIYFDQSTRMHERLCGANRMQETNHSHGPFFDHYHLHFKTKEIKQRRHDVAIYDAVHRGEQPPTFAEFKRRTE